VQLVGRACVVESRFLNGATLGRSVADAAGLPYVSLSPDYADFATVLQAIEEPTVVHLDAGAWQADTHRLASQCQGEIPPALQEQLRHIRELQAAVMQALKSRPVVYLTLTRQMAAFSAPLQQVGGFDRQIALGGPVQDMAGELWLAQLGDCASASLQAAGAKVAGLLAETQLNPQTVLLRLRRLAADEGRSVELADLIDVLLRGTAQRDARDDANAEQRSTLHRVAWHEAGHALMTVLDSDRQRVPDYASACRGTAFDGVVVSLQDAHQPFTYAELRFEVRVALAGRAAEEVAYGSAQVSNGSANDLAAATRKCTRAFSVGGLAPGMDDAEHSASNLALVLGDDPLAMEEVRGLVRRFLAQEYAHVLRTLRDHRHLLDALGERLVADRIVDQQEIQAILGCAAP
jgi:cell division protease FtsH